MNPAVVRDDYFLHQREPEAGSARFGRKKRPENAVGDFRIEPGAVVGDAHAQRAAAFPRTFDNDARADRSAGLERVATEIAESLAQQDFVAFDSPRFGLLKLTPWRIDLVSFPAENFDKGTRVWRSE